jgi:uncharacterized protein (DUF4415 family)
MRKGSSSRLSPKQKAELKVLAALRDDAIDTREMPEIRDWTSAKRGLFYRPLKQQITLRLDADVIAWFKSHARKGEGYQTNINYALRAWTRASTTRSAAGVARSQKRK